MEINVVVDKSCGYKATEAAEKLKEHCKRNKINIRYDDLLIVISNDWEFVKKICKKYEKAKMKINITENFSEQHIINSLKYVHDICYLKSDVNLITTRIMKAYKMRYLRKRVG